VFFGLVLCACIASIFIYSSAPIFWEVEGPQPLVYSMTWRTALMLAVLLVATQGISFLIFRGLQWCSIKRKK
jgi:hypothetical protein